MASENSDVLAVVERALKKEPDLSSRELQQQAAEVDSSVMELSGRQFHARYALPAKKKLSAAGLRPAAKKPARKKPARKRAAGRKSRATRGTPRRARPQSDPVRELLREQFVERRNGFQEELDAAFERSIEGDSLTRLNELLALLDEQMGALRKL